MHLSALRNVENKQFLEKKLIQVLVWPGNSPDLNPVENLWSLMKHKVSKKIIFYGCSTEKCNKEVWVKDMSPDYCLNLAGSMPSRLETVTKNGGGHTKLNVFSVICLLKRFAFFQATFLVCK